MECWGFQSHLEKLSVVFFKTKIGVKQQFIRILVWFPNHFSFCGGSFWPWILIGPTIMVPFFRGSLVEFPLWPHIPNVWDFGYYIPLECHYRVLFRAAPWKVRFTFG